MITGLFDIVIGVLDRLASHSIKDHFHAREGVFQLFQETDDFIFLKILEDANHCDKGRQTLIDAFRPRIIKHVAGDQNLILTTSQDLASCLDHFRKIHFIESFGFFLVFAPEGSLFFDEGLYL